MRGRLPGAVPFGAEAHPGAPGSSPVVPQCEVGVPHRVVHAAAHQLPGLVHGHPGHLVRVALPSEGVVLPGLGIPVMWGAVKEKSGFQDGSPGVPTAQACARQHVRDRIACTGPEASSPCTSRLNFRAVQVNQQDSGPFTTHSAGSEPTAPPATVPRPAEQRPPNCTERAVTSTDRPQPNYRDHCCVTASAVLCSFWNLLWSPCPPAGGCSCPAAQQMDAKVPPGKAWADPSQGGTSVP